MGIRVKSAEMFSDEILGNGIAQHRQKSGIRIHHLAGGVTTADAVGSVGDKGAEVHLGATQTFLCSTQCSVKPADERRQYYEQCEAHHGGTKLRRRLFG